MDRQFTFIIWLIIMYHLARNFCKYNKFKALLTNKNWLKMFNKIMKNNN